MVSLGNTPENFRYSFGLLAICARNLNQLERSLNIVRVVDEKADPAGTRENVMRDHAALRLQKQVAIRTSHEAIEEAISVNVAHLVSPKEETDSAITMHSKIHVWEALCSFFHVADRAQTARRK